MTHNSDSLWLSISVAWAALQLAALLFVIRTDEKSASDFGTLEPFLLLTALAVSHERPGAGGCVSLPIGASAWASPALRRSVGLSTPAGF
jgi:hypothetical protein